jgi:acyl-coenzyme A thioesterase PaaI-like protein
MRDPGGWPDIDALLARSGAHSFVSSDPDGDRLRVRYFWQAGQPGLRARVWFGPGAEGPPRHAHGGSIAGVLDEAMGVCCWLAGHRVLAREIRVEFESMLPLGALTLAEARVISVEGRKIRTEASLRADDGTLFARAEGLFLRLRPEQLASITRHSPQLAGSPHDD